MTNNPLSIYLDKATWAQDSSATISISFGSYDCSTTKCQSHANWSNLGNVIKTDSVPSISLRDLDPPLDSFEQDGKIFPESVYGVSERGLNPPNWKPGASVLREFCHSLGLLYEWQHICSLDPKIKLKKEVILNDLNTIYDVSEDELEITYSWWFDQVMILDDCQTPDMDSIMMKELPDSWVEGDNPTRDNWRLSNTDTQTLGLLYPISSETPPLITVEFVGNGPNEEWKRYWVKKMVMENIAPHVGIRFMFPQIESIKKDGNIVVIISVSCILLILIIASVVMKYR